MKKAQGLSLNVIIVAAIALIVLVILVMIFTGKLGGFGEGVEEVSGEAKLLLAKHIAKGGKGDTCGEIISTREKAGVFSAAACVSTCNNLNGKPAMSLGNMGCTTGQVCCVTK